jgi:hypothetical protein
MRLEECFPEKSNPMAYSFPNNGIIVDRIPNQIFSSLKEEVSRIRQDFDSQEKFNTSLVGHIQKEFGINHMIGILNDYVVDLSQRHINIFNHRLISELSVVDNMNFEFKLESLWINFQKKHEFNPIHVHTGAYSFVIWMQIPYDLEEEKSRFKDMTASDIVPTNFNFYYTDIFGKVQDYSVKVDKTKEGCICLFPSTLNHSVNPFYTSDDFRISISGNVYLKHIK